MIGGVKEVYNREMDPVLYHAHHSRHNEDLPFWRQNAVKRGSPVLELGCGTGRVLLPLAAEGHAMVGLDHDPAMLAFLSDRLPKENPPLIVQSDLRQFAFAVRFPLIILPCNTMTVMPAPDREALYRCVQRHLAPQGWFVVSMPNPAILAELPVEGEPVVEEVFPHPHGGFEVQVSSAWQRAGDRVAISWEYDCLREDGSVRHTTMEQVHHIIPLSTLTRELTASGLRLAETFGDYDGSPYAPDSPYCIIAAGLEK